MGNQWDERFGMKEYVYGEEPNKFIEEHADKLGKEKKVVAFAEGEGRNAAFLARKGHDVTAYDYSEAGLAKTVKLAEKFGVSVRAEKKDLIADPVPEDAFDCAIMVFGHFEKQYQKTVFDKLVKTVKPGGIIMFEVYSEQQVEYKTGGPRTVEMLYDPQTVLGWVKEYRVNHFFYGEKERKEGTGHTGKGHVIQAIFQK